ncbi:MAG: hypothetical protein E5V70_05110 [Mesorhizobium sp.]|nr:MAG: hypothetical protein E5V70_05110 [Mesorhizobium sp.]
MRARDITADAGCALGALYTAFADLDKLILHVNSATLARLGAGKRRRASRGQGWRRWLRSICALRATIA